MDNAGENTAPAMIKMLSEHGIVPELTAPYSPAANGIAERVNRTLGEMSRAMLQELDGDSTSANIKTLWAEAYAHAAWLRNRIVRKGELHSPAEFWHSAQLSLAGLHPWGTVGYAYEPRTHQRDKLDNRAYRAAFVGVASPTSAAVFKIAKLDTSKIELITCRANEFRVITNKQHRLTHNGQQSSFPLAVHAASIQTAQAAIQATASSEPHTLLDAMSSPQAHHWARAMNKELDALEKFGTWEYMKSDSVPKSRTIIPCTWRFKLKNNTDGTITYKARCCARGDMTKPGHDYDPDDLFTPVASHNAIRILLALGTQLYWELFHLDFSSAYLHGELPSPVYMRQPSGPHGYRKPGHICKLIKSIYGLRQAGIIWHRALEDALLRFGFSHSECEHSTYVLHSREHHAVIMLIVDDVMLGSPGKTTVQAISSYLHAN
jgi:Reverse transcriptase (RNA-dependent DNA polymerase)